uniref:Uncharacterized protein n=1 Tax=Octopus bimaculoides TaxID=37653 RepID=A0A0L8G0U5_OCTBM
MIPCRHISVNYVRSNIRLTTMVTIYIYRRRSGCVVTSSFHLKIADNKNKTQLLSMESISSKFSRFPQPRFVKLKKEKQFLDSFLVSPFSFIICPGRTSLNSLPISCTAFDPCCTKISRTPSP